MRCCLSLEFVAIVAELLEEDVIVLDSSQVDWIECVRVGTFSPGLEFSSMMDLMCIQINLSLTDMI